MAWKVCMLPSEVRLSINWPRCSQLNWLVHHWYSTARAYTNLTPHLNTCNIQQLETGNSNHPNSSIRCLQQWSSYTIWTNSPYNRFYLSNHYQISITQIPTISCSNYTPSISYSGKTLSYKSPEFHPMSFSQLPILDTLLGYTTMNTCLQNFSVEIKTINLPYRSEFMIQWQVFMVSLIANNGWMIAYYGRPPGLEVQPNANYTICTILVCHVFRQFL